VFVALLVRFTVSLGSVRVVGGGGSGLEEVVEVGEVGLWGEEDMAVLNGRETWDCKIR